MSKSNNTRLEPVRPHELRREARRNGNLPVQFSLELDSEIGGLQERCFAAAQDLSTTYRNREYAAIAARIDKLADDYDARLMTLYGTQHSSWNWNDFFRLFQKRSFLAESVLAPLYFNSTNPSDFLEQRRALTDGVADASVPALQAALALYELASSEPEKGQLVGVVSESILLALLNRDQSSSRIAVPATTVGDLRHKTDILQYRVHKGTADIDRIQVKTSLNEHTDQQIPGRITVYMDECRHLASLHRTASLLVTEHAVGLDEQDSRLLDTISRHYVTAVNNSRAAALAQRTISWRIPSFMPESEAV